MRKALLFFLALAVCAAPVFAVENRSAFGGGFVDNEADVENSSDIEGDGLFLVFRTVANNGFLFLSSLSITDADDGPIEDDLLRLGLSVGYMFRKDDTVRPFLHGGFGWVQVKEEIFGIEDVDDSSLRLSAGIGLEAGKGRHAFFSNLVLDFGHKVEVNILGVPLGNAEFNLRELHLGYIYRFKKGVIRAKMQSPYPQSLYHSPVR